ncbi:MULTISPECIES: glycosyltransferase [unclassified Sphingobium]|uniref:glycosyltransferase n=1 Tax=unclassified Sphingobium TaxID=2611147 RepID=UPI002224BC6B|nr:MULTISPECIES: glycosyltransferase [unclassified Sphingobium]MCW2411750.1 glycosyltransferase involved in cell wall biosynthesis [Sphingobium sp. B8D3D]MCW2415954.1 glycosyltransferase involved in cell wall biosynthesis [Sphingobium sp. B8D3A]
MTAPVSSADHGPQAVFLFDLIQDINVLRPIIRILAAETNLDLLFLVSDKLGRRDRTGVWTAEIDELASFVGARIKQFEDPLTAHLSTQGRLGLLFSASETDLVAHETNHQVFLAAPNSYVRITIQHGHECVGFRQNREQTIAHGDDIRFAADIVCGWGPVETMEHLCHSERPKYFELGPPMLLDRLLNKPKKARPPAVGLVCENLHSVRMRTTGEFQKTYLDTVQDFATSQAQLGRSIAVRPHPGGQFVVKNNVALPPNVTLANAAMYKTDLKQFAYGISAPSSVVIDLVVAGIPTAVWTDPDGIIDTSGYAGLTQVSTVEDWARFADEAVANPAHILARQAEFLSAHTLDISPEQVRDRLLQLVDGAISGITGRACGRRPARVLLVANGVVPTLHISFLKPLSGLVKAGQLETRIITEADVRALQGQSESEHDTPIADAIAGFSPDLAVFCRYSGSGAEEMVAHLRGANAPIVFHIDDDLLNVPADIGPKHVEHNRVERTSTIRYLLGHADLVYCSTPALKERFQAQGFNERLSVGEIYSSGEIVFPAEDRPVETIGFMGNDKAPELSELVPAIADILDRNPSLRFELFGSMTMPDDLLRFGERVRALPKVSDYDDFVRQFRQLRWDIGLAPLRGTPFNIVKADTKWVDYTSIGTAVIASRATVYDHCCAGGCGILVDGTDEWISSIQSLIDDTERRFALVSAAQAKLASTYTLDRLTNQVLEKFDEAAALAKAAVPVSCR